MTKRKRSKLTSSTRYKLKAFRVHAAGVPEELAKEAADAQTIAWRIGSSPYMNLRDKMMETDAFRKIPVALRGLYLAYCNEVMSRAITRKIEDTNNIIKKWVKLGLDENILRDLAKELGAKLTTETSKTA
jgi:hypothetical protein